MLFSPNKMFHLYQNSSARTGLEKTSIKCVAKIHFGAAIGGGESVIILLD